MSPRDSSMVFWRGALAVAVGVGLLGCGADEDPLDCQQMECFRPYVCAESCDGPVITSGCCPCAAGQIDRFVECRAEPEPPPAPTDAPCAADADCRAITNCDCDCVPELASVPPLQGAAWSTQCNGGPPPNCGVQSPCAYFAAACEDGRCVVRRVD